MHTPSSVFVPGNVNSIQRAIASATADSSSVSLLEDLIVLVMKASEKLDTSYEYVLLLATEDDKPKRDIVFSSQVNDELNLYIVR